MEFYQRFIGHIQMLENDWDFESERISHHEGMIGELERRIRELEKEMRELQKAKRGQSGMARGRD